MIMTRPGNKPRESYETRAGWVVEFFKQVRPEVRAPEIEKYLDLSHSSTFPLLRRMESEGLLKQDPVTKKWSLNANSTAESTPQKSAGLTPRYSPPGVGKTSHSLHHRQR